MMSAATVPKLYRSVIEDVINGVRDMFLDDGVDEQVLMDLKQTWYRKVEETKALADDSNKDKGAATNSSSGSNGGSATVSGNTSANHSQSTNSTSSSVRITNSSRNNNASREISQGTTSITAISVGNNHSTLTQQSQLNQLSQQSLHQHLKAQQQNQSQLPRQTSAQPTITINSFPISQIRQNTVLNQNQSSTQPLTTTITATTRPVTIQQPQVTQISSNTSRTIVTGSALPQQLNFSPGSVIPHTVLQFPSGERADGPKSVPGKVIFLNPQASGLMSSPATAASLALPPELAASLLQQAAFNTGGVINVAPPHPQESVVRHTSNPTSVINGPTTIQFQPASSNSVINQRTSRPSQPNNSANTNVVQLDGPNDNSSDDDDDEDEFRDNDDDHDDNDDDQNDEENEYTGEEEEPLNSEDDVSDEDPHELFDTDNVVVCQYDKITRSRNKWKFHLKDGIMNLQGKDYVFQKAIGDAEW